MSKPTVAREQLRKGRKDSVVQIRKAQIEKGIANRRTLSYGHLNLASLDEKTTQPDATTLFAQWNAEPLDRLTLFKLVSSLVNRTNAPVEELAELFSTAPLELFVQLLESSPLVDGLVDLAITLFCELSNCNNTHFTDAIMQSGLIPLCQRLLLRPELTAELANTTLWLWANLANSTPDDRGQLIEWHIADFATAFISHRSDLPNIELCLPTAAWLFSSLINGSPISDPRLVASILPLLHQLLKFSTDNALPVMETDVLATICNFLSYPTPVTKPHLTPDLFGLIKRCADRGAASAAVATAVFTRVSASDELIRLLFGWDVVEYVVQRRQSHSSTDEEKANLYKCLTNVLDETRDVQELLISRPVLCEFIAEDLDRAPYAIVVEALFFLSTCFYASTSVEMLINVARVDESCALLDYITGRDMELSERIVIALLSMQHTTAEYLSSKEPDKEQAIQFANTWLLSTNVEECLDALMNTDGVRKQAWDNCDTLLTRLQAMRAMLDEHNVDLLNELRRSVHQNLFPSQDGYV